MRTDSDSDNTGLVRLCDRIQDDIDHREASEKYRYAFEILYIWELREIQGYS
jgi:hypothetical protein